jgi:hypothetical protein
MADALDQIEGLLKTMRDMGRHDAEIKALFGQISAGLADVVALLEKPREKDTSLAAALANLKLPAPVINVAPVVKSDLRELRIKLETNSRGEATGMILTRVER